MKKIWFILGYPGSGKSTLCRNLKYKHLPLGKLLRQNTEYKDIIQHCMQTGQLISPNITISVLQKALADFPEGTILIDGFPRNLDNVQSWNKEVNINIKGVIFLNCPENICLERLSQRNRTDDHENCIRQRLLSFTIDTVPVINYYQEQNLVYKIDSTSDTLVETANRYLQT